MFVQLIGFGAFGYLIGNVVTLLSKKDPATAQYLENIENLTSALQIRDLNRDLQKRILNYYNYLRKEKVGYDESSFLEGLPTTLKTEAELELKKNFIVGIPIFKNASAEFVSRIAIKLELVIITPGETLMRQGEEGNEMYFIISGMLDVIRDSNSIFLLKEGDFFGEMALVGNKTRTATVKARTFCNLYKLERKTFDLIISDFPEIVDEIREKAKLRGMPPD
jgi:voltage-gated potassium channel